MKRSANLILASLFLFLISSTVALGEPIPGIWNGATTGLGTFFDGRVIVLDPEYDGSSIGDESRAKDKSPTSPWYWAFTGLLRDTLELGDYVYDPNTGTLSRAVAYTRSGGTFYLWGDHLWGQPEGSLYTASIQSETTGTSYYSFNGTGWEFDHFVGSNQIWGTFNDAPYTLAIIADVSVDYWGVLDPYGNVFLGELNNVELIIQQVPEAGAWTTMGMTGFPYFGTEFTLQAAVGIGDRLIVLGTQMPDMDHVGAIYEAGAWTAMDMTGMPYSGPEFTLQAAAAVGDRLIVLGTQMPDMDHVGAIYEAGAWTAMDMTGMPYSGPEFTLQTAAAVGDRLIVFGTQMPDMFVGAIYEAGAWTAMDMTGFPYSAPEFTLRTAVGVGDKLIVLGTQMPDMFVGAIYEAGAWTAMDMTGFPYPAPEFTLQAAAAVGDRLIVLGTQMPDMFVGAIHEAGAWTAMDMTGMPYSGPEFTLQVAAAIGDRLIVLGTQMPDMDLVGAYYGPSITPMALELVSPNGAEQLFAGSSHEITWISEGEIDYVDIEYSTNNGATWTEIIANTENDGSYMWIIPCDRSDYSLVRITQAGGNVFDTSNGVFSIADDIPPTISLSVSPNILWPPNHKMVSVSAEVTAIDNCTLSPSVRLESIIMNEGNLANTYDVTYDFSMGDGNTVDDIQDADYGTEDYNFSLRAERAGTGTGRVYTINYSVTDDSGNTTPASAEVTVPHNQ